MVLQDYEKTKTPYLMPFAVIKNVYLLHAYNPLYIDYIVGYNFANKNMSYSPYMPPHYKDFRHMYYHSITLFEEGLLVIACAKSDWISAVVALYFIFPVLLSNGVSLAAILNVTIHTKELITL